MNEDQKQPVADATKTQTNGSLETNKTTDKDEQQNVANSESGTKEEQSPSTADQSVKKDQSADAPQEKPVDTSADKSQTADQDKSATDNHAKSSDNSTTEPKKLSDVVPSTIVWLSGMVGKKQFDCAGPFSVPFVLDKPTWPYVTVAPNPKYTNQVFDYDADGGAGKWVPTDSKSQGQLLTDLTTQVSQLSKVNGQSQAMTMQQTQMMVQLNQKYDTINDKLDKLLNTKDGDK